MLKLICIMASVGVAGMSLSGCETTAQVDTVIQQSLPVTCKLIEQGYTTITLASATGHVSRRTAEKVDAAYNGVRLICADPTAVKASNALFLAAGVYLTVSAALKEIDAAKKLQK